MARLLYTILVVLLFATCSYAWTPTNTTDTCYKDRGGIFPCSSSITGNLVLLACYGAILGAAAKCISDGAEMLLDFGLPAALIGGIVLPVLGAVPDAAIIVSSGLGEDAQEKLAVGMGTLAGSTVMLLTVAWSGSLAVGRCDLNSKDESIDQTLTKPLSLTRQGVTVLSDIKSGITIMLVTSLLYLIVQSADWYWGATLTENQPTYVKKAALANMILCFIAFVTFIVFSVLDSKRNERLERLHKDDLLKRRVLHAMVTLAPSGAFSMKKPSDVESAGKTDGSDGVDDTTVSKKYFKAWRMKTGTRDAKEKLGLLDDHSGDDEEDVSSPTPPQSSNPPAEEPKVEDSKTKMLLQCVALLVGGVGLVTIFSDPMCDVLSALCDKRNKSYIPVPLFYVSFVVTPFCSNASELVSSLIFASKKTKENSTMTYSQIFGAATMNNTLCFGIFMVLVYLKNLKWIYGAEIISILLVQWVVGIVSYAKTYKVWMGFPVAFTYIVCLFIVWVLEAKAGWH